jgi:hypothetical protein
VDEEKPNPESQKLIKYKELLRKAYREKTVGAQWQQTLSKVRKHVGFSEMAMFQAMFEMRGQFNQNQAIMLT